MDANKVNWKWFPVVVGISATEMAALTMVRQYTSSKKKRYLVGGAAAYAIVALQLPPLIESSGMGMGNIFWNGCSSAFGVAVGSAVFGEPIFQKDLIGVPLTILGTMAIASQVSESEQPVSLSRMNPFRKLSRHLRPGNATAETRSIATTTSTVL